MAARTNADDLAADSGSPGAEPKEERPERPAVLRPLGRSQLGGDDDDAIESPLARLADLGAGLSQQIRRRPLAFLALALGSGFAVGGALSFRGGRLALSAAARHLGRELLKEVL